MSLLKIAFVLTSTALLSAPAAGQETSYQIRTASSPDEFARKVAHEGALAAIRWNTVIHLKSGQPFAAGDAAAWIRGDIEGRFQGSPVAKMKAVLSDVPEHLGGLYLEDHALVLGSINGQLGAVYGPIAEAVLLNTIRLSPRERAGKAITDWVLPRVKAFAQLAASPGVAEVGLVIAFGTRNFADRGPDAVAVDGEAVAIVMPAGLLTAYLAKSISSDELIDKSAVWLCGKTALLCERLRPTLP